MSRPIPHDVPRRRLDFPLPPAEVPRDFYAGDPSLSLFMSAMSLVFPEGERFFVDSVVHYRDRITDPELMARVRGFAAQEAMHSKEHAAFNAMLEAQGVSAMASLGRDVAALLRRARRRRTREEQLAITCALEHITAILGEELLTDDAHREAIHESVRGLWAWHALEECEHKSVAFDVYRAVDGSERTRVLTMKGLRVGLIFGIAVQMLISLSMDPATYERGRLRSSFRRFRSTPIFRREIWDQLREYDRRGFHPDDRDTTELADRWREILFGENGQMLDRLAGPRGA